MIPLKSLKIVPVVHDDLTADARRWSACKILDLSTHQYTSTGL